MIDDELVSVFVPRRHLSQVYGLIAQLDATSPAMKSVVGAVVAGQPTSDEWTPSRLRTMVEDSGPAVRDILRALAVRPGDWLSTHDLAGALKRKPKADWNTIAGTLGAFGRRIKSRYGLETWPFNYKRDHEARGWVYSMSPEVAARILPLLDGDK